MASGVASWSQTAATNATADSNVNAAEGMAPSALNDMARAMMSSVAKWRDDISGSLTTGGSSTAYTVTTNQSFASLAALDGHTISIKLNATNGASPTLAVDGLTAKALTVDGTTAVPTASMVSGSVIGVTYNASAGAFIVHGAPASAAVFTTVSATSTITAGGQFKAPDGTKTAPGHSFTNDLDTGIYLIGSNNLGISCGDTKIVDVATTGATVTGGLTATSALTGATAAGAMLASQAEQETGTATNKLVAPGTQHFHASAAKGWCICGNTGSVSGSGSYNVASITDNTTGDVTVVWATDFSDENYSAPAIGFSSAAVSNLRVSAQAAGSTRYLNTNAANGAADPTEGYEVSAFGDFA